MYNTGVSQNVIQTVSGHTEGLLQLLTDFKSQTLGLQLMII